MPFPTDTPASQALDQDPRAAVPLIRLETTEGSWRPRRDLLNADRFDQGFVPERERDGRVSLRFGDDVSGRRPPAGTVFQVAWWRGGGAAGNLGHDALSTLVTDRVGLLAATNPLPAVGGTDPEDIEHARQHAPVAFATQERAVTTADWVAAALRLPEVANATARVRWTGSWWTVFLTLDLTGGQRLTDEPELAPRFAGRLDRFRVAGYDLQLRDPVDLPVELGCGCASPPARSGPTSAGPCWTSSPPATCRRVRGFFHPDRFSFGTALHVSQLLAAAVTVPGVTDVRVTELHPVGVAPGGELADRVLRAGDTEVDPPRQRSQRAGARHPAPRPGGWTVTTRVGREPNPPGRRDIAYRLGRQADFAADLVARLGARPELAGLTTREIDDPAVALLHAWATTLDVLAFYQERIANEGFLGTATERRSVLMLARAIGYELRPGVAATTWLRSPSPPPRAPRTGCRSRWAARRRASPAPASCRRSSRR